MKQHITPKQAKEITKEQFYKLFPDLVVRDNWANYHHKKITIGKMIEVLREKRVALIYKLVFHGTPEADIPFEKLCDELWNEVKCIS